MAEDQPGSSKPLDPFESFRKMRDAYLDAMAKAMIEAVNTENYALAAGTMLDTSLTASAPLREAFEKTMLQVLQQLSLPSARTSLRWPSDSPTLRCASTTSMPSWTAL